MIDNRVIVVGALALLTILTKRETITDTAIMATNYQNSMSNREKFAPIVRDTENANGIPRGMLDKLLMAESSYREDIITGKKKSVTGATGIAQFMPATAAEWGVNPLDPISSIVGAGRYLTWLHGQTGSWIAAVAAYNWGVGNVKKAVKKYGEAWLSHAPTETKNYVGKIV